MSTTRYIGDQLKKYKSHVVKFEPRITSPTRESLTRVERRLPEMTALRRFPCRERTMMILLYLHQSRIMRKAVGEESMKNAPEESFSGRLKAEVGENMAARLEVGHDCRVAKVVVNISPPTFSRINFSDILK